MKQLLGSLLLMSLTLSSLAGCSTPPVQQIITYPTKEAVQTDQSEGKQEDLSLMEIDVPLFTASEEKSLAPVDKRTNSQIVIDNSNKYKVTARKAQFFGGAVIYNYIPNHVYQLFCKPYAVTDIALEPGEVLASAPVSGDTMNFILGQGMSIENGQEQIHLYIKPIYEYKNTTLNINTNRRSYRFEVQSFKNTAMSIISFDYPLDAMKKISVKTDNRIKVGNSDITQLNYNYKIIPMSADRPAWTPSIVFNDGQKTYINFASAERAAYAPVLFEVVKKKRMILNYRVQGTYYIIDSIPREMEIVLENNADNIIKVVYEGFK